MSAVLIHPDAIVPRREPAVPAELDALWKDAHAAIVAHRRDRTRRTAVDLATKLGAYYAALPDTDFPADPGNAG